MTATPRPRRRFSGKTLVTVLLIFLTVSMVGFMYVSRFAVPRKEGPILLSREEVQWLNVKGAAEPTFDSRYLINYAVTAAGEADQVTITDKTSPGLTLMDITQDRGNVQIEYNKDSGEVKITARKLAKDEKFIVQVAFQTEPIHVFDGEMIPVTFVSPSGLAYGYNGRVKAVVSPFRIKSMEGITTVGIYAWLTTLAADRAIVSSQPTAESKAPAYEAIWRYGSGSSPDIGAHSAEWNVLVSSDKNQGDTLLRTWVEVKYAQSLHVTGDPVISDSKGNYYSGGGTSFSYQYEFLINPS